MSCSISRCILVITVIAICNSSLKGQASDLDAESESLYRLQGWFSLSSRVTDFTNSNSFFKGVNVNLYAGMQVSNWLAVCVGPGLRTNPVNNVHFPFYGGLRVANQKGMISPHLFLAGGYNADGVLGNDFSPFQFLSELGLQFNTPSTAIILFISYETLSMYRSEEVRVYSPTRFRKVPERYTLLSVGFTLGF